MALTDFVNSRPIVELKPFRDNFQNERCKHPGIRIFLRAGESGADLLGEFLIDSCHFNQAFEIRFDECDRPLPHVIARTQAKNVRP